MKKILILLISVMMALGIGTRKVYAVASGMSVSATADSIVIELNEASGGVVYAFDANGYAQSDAMHGISEKISGGEKVADYGGGSATITWDRYDDKGRDRLYDKYYLLNDAGIVDGPKYVVSEPSAHSNIRFAQDSIKGLFNEDTDDMSYANDLGVSSITNNISISSLLTDEGDNTIVFKSNGKDYYFNKSVVETYDKRIAAASSTGKNVIGIIIADNAGDYPTALRYDGMTAGITGTNTSNDEGRDDYIAIMEFLADRYSKDASTGLIQTYVIGNEIDFTPYFYNCGDLNTFMEEYSRSLRLANLAVKKYAGDAQVVVPFTRYWCGDEKQIGKENAGYSLKPYDMINWLATYTNARGAYDWGIAPHVNCSISTTSNVSAGDIHYGVTNGDYASSGQLSFSNVEMLQGYLSQDYLQYNGGLRSVYLTESGVSSKYNTEANLNEQCASLAQSYYKVANLSFIKSFNYYRLKDHQAETAAGLCDGLLNSSGEKKPVYELYKNIDHANTLDYTDSYLQYIQYKKNGSTKVTTANDLIRGWKDTMTVYDNGFDWNTQWNLNNIVRKSEQSSIASATADSAHIADGGTVITEASTTSTGLIRYRCTRCNALVEEVIVPQIVNATETTVKEEKKTKKSTNTKTNNSSKSSKSSKSNKTTTTEKSNGNAKNSDTNEIAKSVKTDKSNTNESANSVESNKSNNVTEKIKVTSTKMKKTVYVTEIAYISLKGAKSFQSSNKKIAKVTQKGKVTFKKTGKVTISFKKNKITYKIIFTVKKPVLKLSKTSVTLKKKQSVKIKVKKLKPYNSIVWKVKNKKIAKIRKGKITGLKKGKTYVIAEANGQKVKVKVKVTDRKKTKKNNVKPDHN